MASETPPPRVALIDNFDSFVFNLYQAIGALTGEPPEVFRNDALTVDQLAAWKPTHLVLSPGPGNPEQPERVGICVEAVQRLGPALPVLGVCLGHQAIGVAYGAEAVRAKVPMHGKPSAIHHRGHPLFAGLAQPFEAMRYHSLVLREESLPPALEIIATLEDGTVMAVAHRKHPVLGVQFHPESIGTPEGSALLHNFLVTPWPAQKG